jgi:RecA/RadA recombinase
MGLQDLLQLTQKQFKKKKPDSDLEFKLAKDEKPPTGFIVNNPLFEYILDRRFLPYGRFYLVYGKKGSSKTSLFFELAKQFQRNGGDVIWLETENAADLDYAVKQGVDVNRLIIQHPATIEEALTLAEMYVKNMPKAYPDGQTPVLICLDSIAGSTTEYELDSSHSITDMMPGIHARLLSRFYREMEKPLASEKCVFLVLNQLKEKIGAMGFGEDVSDSMMGGNAPLFSSTYQFKMKLREQLTAPDEHGAKRKIGSRHIIECKRNKLGREGKGQDIEVDLYIDGGMDWWAPLVRKLGANYPSIVYKSGGWYTWKIPNTKFIDPLTSEEKDIDIEQTYREEELALIISRSIGAQEEIRKAFGIPDLPPEDEVKAVEEERLTKRKKKKALTEDGDETVRKPLTLI